MMTSYILWNINPEIFTLGPFTLRWNTLLILIAYLTGRRLLFYIFRKERADSADVTILTGYLLILSLLFARLVFVALYEPQIIWTNPAEVLFPFSFRPGFHLTDSAGFSIYGAAMGALVAVWLYSRKKKTDHQFLNTLDRVSLLSALTAVFLFSGSFLNSEIVGKPTDSPVGIVFTHPVEDGLKTVPCCIMRNPNGENPLIQVVARRDNTVPKSDTLHQGVILYLFFKPGATEQLVNEFLIGDVKTFLFDMADYVHEPGTEPLHYSIIVAKDGQYIGRVQTRGITRHPVQIIGALISLTVFVLLFIAWHKKKRVLTPGKLSGYFMIAFWSVHLVMGFLTEKQGLPEKTMDIILILSGIIVLAFSATKQKAAQLLEKKVS